MATGNFRPSSNGVIQINKIRNPLTGNICLSPRNTIKDIGNIITGDNNYVLLEKSLIVGNGNSINAISNIVNGDGHNISSNYNLVNGINHHITGIGYNIVSGSSCSVSIDKNLVIGDNINLTGIDGKNLAIGKNININSDYNLVSGSGITISGNSFNNLIVGESITIDTGSQFNHIQGTGHILSTYSSYNQLMGTNHNIANNSNYNQLIGTGHILNSGVNNVQLIGKNITETDSDVVHMSATNKIKQTLTADQVVLTYESSKNETTSSIGIDSIYQNSVVVLPSSGGISTQLGQELQTWHRITIPAGASASLFSIDFGVLFGGLQGAYLIEMDINATSQGPGTASVYFYSGKYISSVRAIPSMATVAHSIFTYDYNNMGITTGTDIVFGLIPDDILFPNILSLKLLKHGITLTHDTNWNCRTRITFCSNN